MGVTHRLTNALKVRHGMRTGASYVALKTTNQLSFAEIRLRDGKTTLLESIVLPTIAGTLQRDRDTGTSTSRVHMAELIF